MTDNWQGFQFSEPSSYHCEKLFRFVESLDIERTGIELPELPLVTYPPQTIEQILQDIIQGRQHEVTLLEWIHLIQEKSQWDRDHADEATGTSRRIWEVAKENDQLLRIMLWRICLSLSFSSKKQWIAESLSDCFEEFSRQRKTKSRLAVKIVRAMAKKEKESLISKLSIENLQTPRNLFVMTGLPKTVPITREALNYAVQEIIPAPKMEEHISWFLACAGEMSQEQKIDAANSLLENMSKESGLKHKGLLEWLRVDFGPRVPGSMWKNLSSESRKKLREWIGGANYKDFRTLVDLLLKELPEYYEILKDWEVKQLYSRKSFWINYSDRFERIRILLPATTMEVLGDKIGKLRTKDIDQLGEDGSDETEVCIFDFKGVFIVEFFRGPGSEMRIFRKTTRLEELFFGDVELSLKHLRSLGGEKHDHRFLWQYYCEKTLRDKEIFPNDGTVQFEGLPGPKGAYSPSEGLRKPFDDLIEEREKKLLDWKIELDRLEWEAVLYMNNQEQYINLLSRSIASSLVENKFVDTINMSFLREKIKLHIEETTEWDFSDIRRLMNRHRNISDHPHFVSLHLTNVVINKLLKYEEIEDVYGDDRDIYVCIDQGMQDARDGDIHLQS